MTTITVLLLDTETNGLPLNRFAPPSHFDAYPAILQLSWGIYTITGRTIATVKTRDIGLALDPTIPWNAGAAAVHGISEVEARHGTAPEVALTELREALRSVDVVAAHNLSFDKPVLRAAAYRVGIRDLWPPAPSGVKEFCTMRETRDLLRIPSPSVQKESDITKFKLPSLNELYGFLYSHRYDISGASLHSARSDVHCLAQCIAGLLKKGFLDVTGEKGLSMLIPST